MKLDFSSDNSAISLVDEDIIAQNGHSENESNEEDNKTLRAGIKAAQRGDRTEARQMLLRVTETEPRSESAWLWLASISEYPEELLIFLNNVLEINPENERAVEWAKATKSLLAKTFVQRGIEANQQEQKQFARQCFMQAIVHDSRNEMAWLWLASVTETNEEKISHFHRVLEINPENETALESVRAAKEKMMQTVLAKAENAIDGSDFEKAEKYLNEVLEYNPQNVDGWFLKSRMANTFEDKMTCLEKILESDPADKKAHNAIQTAKNEQTGKLFAQAENAAGYNREAASEYLEQIFALDPNHENAWFMKSQLTDSAEEKMSCLEKVLEFNPENEQAVEALKEAQKDQAGEFFAKANDAANDGNRELANEFLAEVFDRDPKHEDAWILKSRMTDSFERKIECFEKILEFNPENETAKAGINLRAMLNGNMPKPEAETSFMNETVAEEMSEDQNHDGEASQFVAEANEVFEEAEEIENAPVTEEETAPVASFESETVSASDETQEFKYYEETEEAKMPETVFSEEQDIFSVEEKREEHNSENESTEMKADEPNYFVEDLSPEDQPETKNSEFENPEEIFAEYAENYGVEDFSGNATQELDMAEIFVQPEMSENGFHAETSKTENSSEEMSAEMSSETAEMFEYKMPEGFKACPFCTQENEAQAFICRGCRSLLTLSDMEMILAYNEADTNSLRDAVENLEVEDAQRGLESDELVTLAIGHINLKNLRKGLDCLQKASKLDPNNVVIESQANSLAIRLSEIEEMENIHSSMPKDRTIMVVDDSATVRKLISGKLEKCGHVVITAVDGVDAMAKLNDVVPDLILLDITMPRMDGYQVCKLIRNNDMTKDVPVVMISGKDGFFDKVRGRMAGTTGYITKPFGPETLMKMLDTYLVEKGEFVQ